MVVTRKLCGSTWYSDEHSDVYVILNTEPDSDTKYYRTDVNIIIYIIVILDWAQPKCQQQLLIG